MHIPDIARFSLPYNLPLPSFTSALPQPPATLFSMILALARTAYLNPHLAAAPWIPFANFPRRVRRDENGKVARDKTHARLDQRARRTDTREHFNRVISFSLFLARRSAATDSETFGVRPPYGYTGRIRAGEKFIARCARRLKATGILRRSYLLREECGCFADATTVPEGSCSPVIASRQRNLYRESSIMERDYIDINIGANSDQSAIRSDRDQISD